jgi:hypothetical protein
MTISQVQSTVSTSHCSAQALELKRFRPKIGSLVSGIDLPPAIR